MAKEAILDNVESSVEISDTEYLMVNATINQNTNSEPAKAKTTIYREEDQDVPQSGDEIEIYINETLVYRGNIREVKYNDEESSKKIKLVSYDIIKQLKTATYTSTYSRYSDEYGEDGDKSRQEYPNEKSLDQLVEEVVYEVFEDMDNYTLEEDLIFTIDTSSTKYKNDLQLESGDDFYPDNTTNKVEVGVGKDIENFGLVIDVEEESCKRVLDKLANISGGIWYVNHENKIVFGKPNTPDENKDGTPYAIDYIIEREDGQKITPYKGVKVIGADITRIETRPEEINKKGNPNRIQRRYKPTEVTRGKKPFYEYQDPDIKSKEMAETVADNIMNKLQSGENAGQIKAVVNTENIKPYMVIRYPENLGGYMFVVNSITHEINNEDGFITTIDIGSLVDPEKIDSV